MTTGAHFVNVDASGTGVTSERMATTEQIAAGQDESGDLELVPLEDLIAEVARRHDGFVAAGFKCWMNEGGGQVQMWRMGDDVALAVIAETLSGDENECDEP